jgi:hypothetical protein
MLASAKKIDLRDSIGFVKAALASLNLKVPKTFYDTVSSEDVVEVYDLSQRQIFRNLRFYELTRYSLADLLTFEWHELYYRPSFVNEGLFTVVNEIVSSGVEKLPLNVKSHLMKEIKADPVHVSQVDFKFISPTYEIDSQTKAGFIVNCRGKNILDSTEEATIEFI